MNLLLISRDFCYTDTCLIKSPGRIEVSAWRGNVQGEIMLGIIYLLLAGMLGCEASKMLTGEGRSVSGINRIWLMLPASFGVGTLLLTWMVYIISWFFSVVGKAENPLLYGNIIGMTGAAVIMILLSVQKYRKQGSYRIWNIDKTQDKRRLKKEILLFGLLTVFITYMMFYVFYIKDGILYSGLTVYGDYAPHTAMMRSFSAGNNFPTQYPHYGGADVKYHFMFQFLTGNLEYLGMRMDFAYNIVSTLSLVGFLMLLYQLALRITGKMCCGVLALFLFFFRSGMAFFRFVWEHIQAGNLVETLEENTSFIGYTVNENWGLWNFNVYLNQRHLAFGLLMVTLALYLFMDWLEAGTAHEEKGILWIKNRNLFEGRMEKQKSGSGTAYGNVSGSVCVLEWGSSDRRSADFVRLCDFLGWKVDYAVMAGVSIFFSWLQSKIFIVGSAMSPQIYLGFLAEDKTVPGVVKYLFWMSGVFFLGLVLMVWFMRRRERAILVSFLFPVIFAFVLLMTPDINVNHKYIMISYAFLTIFWAWAVCSLWKGRNGQSGIQKTMGKILAIVLVISLSVTGIYDFVVIIKGNGPGRRVTVNMNSELTQWLEENLEKNDLLLTPEYSMNEVTMSGAMLYCGWPYYAWSAGYDTNYRAAQAVTIYTTSDSETLKKTVQQEKITYILFEEGSEFEQQECREETIAAAYEKVYETQDGRIRIYKTTE